MSNLELDFVVDRDTYHQQFPRANVFVKFSTGNGYITQTCMSASELDGEINRLIKELENIRSRGHAKFKPPAPDVSESSSERRQNS